MRSMLRLQRPGPTVRQEMLEMERNHDAIFYEVVMEERETTDTYLVTGNIKHFPVKPYAVTPKEMLDILNGNEI